MAETTMLRRSDVRVFVMAEVVLARTWDPSRRRDNFGRPACTRWSVRPTARRAAKMTTAIAVRQGRGCCCRKDENSICPARVRIVAEPLEANVEGCVIEMWRNPTALNIAQSDDDRTERITKISDEMAQIQRQKNGALKMRLRNEVDLKTYRAIARELAATHDQLDREHKRLTSEANNPSITGTVAGLG
jgi:hypothetical protein